MNAAEMVQQTTLVSALGWTLVHFLWQGALVGALLLIANGFIKREASNVRYVAACFALMLMLALPLGTFFTVRNASVPAVPKPAVLAANTGNETASSASHGIGGTGATDGLHSGQSTAGRAASGSRSQTEVGSAHKAGAAKARDLAAVPHVGAATELQASTAPRTLSKLQKVVPVMSSALVVVGKSLQSSLAAGLKSWVPWFVMVWSIGVALLSLRLLGGWLFAQRLKRSGIDQPIAELQRTVNRLAHVIGVSKPIRVCKSVLIEVPTVIGWLRPAILVPASAITGLTPKQLESLLAHELAHVRRHDYLVNLIQTVIETLLFYHPAVWWVSRCIRAERENACDDIAVDACGDRVVYVRALCELEHLRAVAPELALSANGGSLMDRIQRLVGAPSEPAHTSRWTAGLVTMSVMLFVVQSVFVGPLGTGVSTVTAAATKTANWRAETTRHANELQLTIERREGSHSRWSSSSRVSIDELQGLTEAQTQSRSADVEFAMVRDAGRLVFEGHFRNERGLGTCQFTASPEYVSDLRRRGYRPNDDQLFSLFTHDASRDYIDDLATLGYDDLKLERIMAFAIHDVSPEWIRGLNDLGYTNLQPEKMLAMRIHDVTPDFVRGMEEAGYRNIPGDKLVAMRIHDVDPEFVRAMAEAGYSDLSGDKLVAMRIHDVDPDFVRRMKDAGYDDLSADKLVAMRIHDVDPDFVRQMKDSGHEGLSVDKLVAMRIHDVDPDFIRAMEEAGYSNISQDQLVAMRIHDVSPAFIREMERLGYRNVPSEKLIAMRIHDVDPKFVRAMDDLGYTGLPIDKLVAMRIHDVSQKFVHEMEALGYKRVPVDQLVAMRIHDVSPRDVREYKSLGYDDVPVEQLVAMRIHDVSPSFIRRAHKRWGNDLTIEELIEIRIRGGRWEDI